MNGQLDVSLVLRQQMVECQAKGPQLDADTNTNNAGLLSHNHAAACLQLDGVPIPDATKPEPVLHQTVSQQSNDIPKPNTAGPKIMPDDVHIPDATEPEPVLHQAVSQQLNDIPDPNIAGPETMPDDIPIPNATEPEPVLHQAVGQQLNDIPNPNAAFPKIVPQQKVGLHLDVVSDGARSEFVLHHMEDLQLDGVVADHPSDGVSVPDVTGTGPAPRQVAHQHLEDNADDAQDVPPLSYFSSSSSVGQQSNDIVNSNAASPKIMPQQVDLHLDIVSEGASTKFIPHHMKGLQLDSVVAGHPSDDVSIPNVTGTGPVLHQAMHQHLGGNIFDVDGAQVAPPKSYFSPFGPLDIPGQYMHLNQKLIFLLSTVVAFIAIVIQYELGPEMLHRSTGLTRPGWACHHKEGWKRKELARQ